MMGGIKIHIKGNKNTFKMTKTGVYIFVADPIIYKVTKESIHQHYTCKVVCSYD